MDNNTDETNCSSPSIDQLNIIIIYSAAGAVGIVVATVILIVLLYARAYKTILQRLIIYSVLTVIVQDFCHLATIMEYSHLRNVNATQVNDSIRCAWLGFIINWSGWTEYMFYLVIIFYLLGVLCVQVKGAAHRKKLKAWKMRFEVLIILFCAFLPGLVMWIPLLDSKYAWLDKNVCFFTIQCDNTNFWYIFFFKFFGYELVTLFCVVVAIGLFIIYCVLSSKLRLQRAKVMMKYLIVLLAAVIVNSVMINIYVVGYTKSLTLSLFFFLNLFFSICDQ